MHYDGERLVSDNDKEHERIEEQLRALADSDLRTSETAEKLLELIG